MSKHGCPCAEALEGARLVGAALAPTACEKRGGGPAKGSAKAS
jgi:hypothetical protein